MNFLSSDAFKYVVSNAPLIAIDLLVINSEGDVLLGMRSNSPAKLFWFVPGGRVFKNEPLSMALSRICLQELGVVLENEKVKLHGVYDHIYPNGPFDECVEINSHYIVIAISLRMEINLTNLPTKQHGNYKYMKLNEVLERDDVHQFSKNYFQLQPFNLFL